MLRRTLSMLLLFFCLFSSATFAQQRQLPIFPIIQQSPVWCWAAASEMYFRYKSVSSLSPAGYQCAVAALIVPECNNNCANCLIAAPSWTYFGQVVERYPRLVSTVLQNSRWLSFQFEDNYGSMTYADIKSAIDDDKPVFAGINPSSGISLRSVPQHVAMIIGYRDIPDNPDDGYLIINDPFPYPTLHDPYIAAGGTKLRTGRYRILHSQFTNYLNWTESGYVNDLN